MVWDDKDTLILGGWILTICGWIAQYRLSIRSKKKDFEMLIVNEIRETAISFIADIFERLEESYRRKNSVGKVSQVKSITIFSGPPNYKKFKKDIELILIRNSHIIGFFRRWKIMRKMNKISSFAMKAIEMDKWNDENHDKYRKIFYQHLNTIGLYQ